MSSPSWPIYTASIEFTTKYKLPVEFDTATQILLTNETHEDEDDAFAKVPTLPTGVLVVRVYGCTGLSNPDFRADADLLVYARAICGPMGKSTNHIPFAKGKPVWNEKLFFPVQFTENLKSKSNCLSILIIWRDEVQDNTEGVSKHYLLGQADFRLNQLARRTKSFQTVDIIDKKQENAGKLQIEMALLYGPFGFGQSHQLEDQLYKPEESVKMSLYPKVRPSYEGPQCRGMATIPKKIKPPSLIPFNKRAENLEPEISETYGSRSFLKSQKNFPTLKSQLSRLSSLQEGLLMQNTRTNRILYLRGILRYLDKYDPTLSDGLKPTSTLKPPNIQVVNSSTTICEAGSQSIASDHESQCESEDRKFSVSATFIENMRSADSTLRFDDLHSASFGGGITSDRQLRRELSAGINVVSLPQERYIKNSTRPSSIFLVMFEKLKRK